MIGAFTRADQASVPHSINGCCGPGTTGIVCALQPAVPATTLTDEPVVRVPW